MQRPRVGHAFADQRVHRIEVLPELVAQRLVGHQVRAQPHPRDRRLQVVRDRRQDLHPLGGVAGDALLHRVEGARGMGHFGRAVLGDQARREVRAEIVGRRRQRVQRPRHQPHRHPGAEGQHHQLRHQHPGDPLGDGHVDAARMHGDGGAVAQSDQQLIAPRADLRDALDAEGPQRLRQRVDERAAEFGVIDRSRLRIDLVGEREAEVGPLQAVQPRGALGGRQAVEDGDTGGDVALDARHHQRAQRHRALLPDRDVGQRLRDRDAQHHHPEHAREERARPEAARSRRRVHGRAARSGEGAHGRSVASARCTKSSRSWPQNSSPSMT